MFKLIICLELNPSKAKLIPDHLLHGEADPDWADEMIDVGGLSLNPNFLRTAGAQTVKRNENGEFLYEYSAEVDPTSEAYR